MVPNFSVVLIARNEEKTLPRLIKSLAQFQERGGEILVLDTGSTDKTAEIARNLGCIVHEVGTKFLRVIDNADEINNRFIVDGETPIIQNGDKLFDFASARNYIADFASNDMIATPDCDEIYTKFDIDKICETIDTGIDQLEYNFVFSHDEYGNEAIKFQHSKFYNRKKLHWEGIIHEVLVGDAKRAFLGEDIIKLEHWQNHETNRGGYLRGLALNCFLHQDNDRNSHYFARELMWYGRPKSAIKEFERHISMNRWLTERVQSVIFIGDCYGMLNNPEKQVEYYNKAIYLDSTRREPFIKLARFYKSNNNPRLTAAYATAALEIPWSPFYANDMAHYTHEPHELLYWAKGWLGDVESARKHILKALSYKPRCREYHRDLVYYFGVPMVSIIIPQLGREEGLKKLLASIDRLDYPKELLQVVIIDGEGTVPQKVKTGLERCNANYIVYAANDMEFTGSSLRIAVKDSMENNKGLVAFDTGVRNSEGYTCEHFLITRDLITKLGGEIFDTEFYHVGVDDLLWHKASKLGEAMQSKAFVFHEHFSRIGSGVQADEINEKGWLHAEEDRKLLQKKLGELYGQ